MRRVITLITLVVVILLISTIAVAYFLHNTAFVHMKSQNKSLNNQFINSANLKVASSITEIPYPHIF